MSISQTTRDEHSPTPPPCWWPALITLSTLAKFQLVWRRLCDALKILANTVWCLLVFRSLGSYELVQDKRRKFPPSRMPLAPSTRMLHTRYLVSHSPRWAVEEGDHVQLLFSGPRICASAKTCSPPITGHRKGQKWPDVSVGEKLVFTSFSEWGDCGYSKVRL